MGQIITVDNLAGQYQVEIPNEPQFESEILFAGNKIEDQFWIAPGIPKSFSSASKQNKFWEEEMSRCYIDGQWVAIKGDLYWIPPSYYFFLNHWKIKRSLPEFRMKKLKHMQFKHMIRNDHRWMGTLTVKNRRDGETTCCMSELVWEALPSEDSWFGIQSQNEKKAKDVCWRELMKGFKRLNPRFLVDSDGRPIWEGKTDSTRLVFKQPKKTMTANTTLLDLEESNDQETIISYTSSGTDAFDGFELRRLSLDEWLKWVDTDPLQALSTYEECVMPSGMRVGLIDLFSSPVEKKSKYTDDLFQFWKDCNPQNIDPETGVSKTRIARWFSNPLDGIYKHYDKYGFGKTDEIRKYIATKRASKSKANRPAEIRKYPCSEVEAFGAYESVVQWSNQEGMESHLMELQATEFKDEFGTEKKYVFGRLRWPNEVPDSGIPEFVPNYDLTDFDKLNRFCFSYQPPSMEAPRNLRKPPKLIESIIGVDPYDYRKPQGNRISMGAGAQFRFLDTRGVGRIKSFDSVYKGRPQPEVFYEDMIMYCLYTQSLMQVEDKNRKIIDYFEDRQYDDWLLPKDMWGDPTKKGNSPNGQTGFIDGIFALIDEYFSEPQQYDDPYYLKTFWFDFSLKDVLDFDREDTHKNDESMSIGQALFGAQKYLARFRKKQRPVDNFGSVLNDFLF